MSLLSISISLVSKSSSFIRHQLSRIKPALILAFTFVFCCAMEGSSNLDAHHSSSKVNSKSSQSVALSSQEQTATAKKVNLLNGNDLPTFYAETSDLTQDLQQNAAKPLTLVSADFDQDGVPDLLVGYRGSNGGILTLFRGNIDSIYPNSPDAEQRKAQNAFTDSVFLSPARVFSVPVAPEFLTTGDFDGDGYLDVVMTAHESQTLYLLTGNGQGQFGTAKQIELSGNVTAMATAERNQTLVVGINRADNAELLVFNAAEGLLNAKPNILSLPVEATTIAFGQLYENNRTDLVIASGQILLIVPEFLEQLSLERNKAGGTSSAKIINLSFSFVIASMAIGHFTESNRIDIALLASDGTVQLINHRKEKSKNEGKSKEVWGAESFAQRSFPKANRLMRARITSNSTDDLILVDSTNHRLHILFNNAAEASSQANVADSMHNRDSVSFDLENEPLALLPMRLNSDALDDLVILRSDNTVPWTVVTQTAMTFIVTNTNDSGAGSLRQAILDANTNLGTDTINFSIPGAAPHTITPLSALPSITDPVMINGTSQPDFSGSPVVELNGISAGGADGLTISAGNSVVRGLIINRFTGNGIVLNNNNNIVEGNFIGTNSQGTFALGNTMDGVLINNGSNNTIGGTTGAARNLISGNLHGIEISGAGTANLVRGNFIGTNVTGISAIGNSANGILISGSSNNSVGAVGSASSNIIAFNGSAGVAMPSGTGNSIISNSIFLNGGLGIDLGTVGVTPNDQGDPDTGANNLQNFPVITSASNAGVSTAVEGTLNSTPNTSFRLEFFSNQASNPSGFGEGQSLIGFINVTTDGTGNANFSQTFPVTVAPGQAITSTATRTSAPLDTSEFSRAVQVGGVTGGQPADLSVLTSLSPNPVQTGSGVTQSIIVSNAGPGTAMNVTVNVLLPATTTFSFCDATGGGVCGGTGNSRTITFSSLAPGITASITIAARVNCNVANGIPISTTAVVFSSTTPDLNTLNNTATATTLSSNPAPIISCPADIAQPNDPGKCSAVVNFSIPIVIDNCPSTTVVCTPASGSNFEIGTTRVSCVATDTGGATANCSFNISILDLEPVRITCPSNVVINAVPGQCSPVVTYPAPTVSDNCPGATVSCVPPSGSTFPIGTTTVNCVTTDAKGGQSICSFSVTVNDAPQTVIRLEGNRTALEFGPTSAKGKSRKLKKQPARNFTIENTGCQSLILSLDSIMRTGNDVDRGRISNPDDRGLFSLRLIDSTGTETPVEVLMDIRIAPGEKKNFRVRFNPVIPAVEKSTTDLSADQVLPDLVTSKIVFTQNAGPRLTINLIGQVGTEVKLINPDNPKQGAFIAFSRVDNDFIVEYSIYDSNLDVNQATYQFFDRQNRPVGRELTASLSSLIQQSRFVTGQSFTIVQRLTGAKDHPEIVGVIVTVSDTESSDSANSVPGSSVISNAIMQSLQPTDNLKLFLPVIEFRSDSYRASIKHPER